MAAAVPPLQPLTLSRAAEPIGCDAAAMYAEGLTLLRRLAGRTWTDHNLHDPGITTLELATWALAELGYRATLPITDLLAAPPGAGPTLAEQFHRARDVLPMGPLTALDWRRLLIDLEGVKNAWVFPVTPPPLYVDMSARQLSYTRPAHGQAQELRLGGLYRVAIDFMDSENTLAEQDVVLRRVRAALERQRNLCEDFVAIDRVPTQRFALCAEVDLDSDADVTEVAARLLFDASQAIAPAVPSHSLAAMRARPGADGQPRSVAEIFEGPLLVNGFIDEAELARSELPAALRLSDLIGVLMDVPGVRAITDIVLSPLGADGLPTPVDSRWSVPVAAGHLPRLAIDREGDVPPAGRLVLRKRGLPVAGWNLVDLPAGVRSRLDALRDEARRSVETPRAEELPLPAGRWRDLARYRSLQLDFPPLYGLGESGLPGQAADALRQAQVLQFKAWLMLFDQQIANDMAQLARGRHLLSVHKTDLDQVAERFADPALPYRTLAAAVVDSVPGHARVYPDGVTDEGLARLQQGADAAIDHQQRLLDHLLARLGEDFSDYAATMASAFGHTDAKLIADKCAFLGDAAELAAGRARGYEQRPDDPARLWNTDNVSGLERRLARLLGIADFTRRNLGAVSYDTYTEVDSRAGDNPHDEYRFRVRHAGDNKILLSSTVNFASREAARARMMTAIQRGQRVENYELVEGRDGKWYFRVTDAEGKLLARRIEGFASADAARAEIAGLAAYLRDHYSGEGLYVFENILLRPAMQRDLLDPSRLVYVHDADNPAADDPLLPICIDGDCDDCADADPYSWRLQIVLPAYAGRFQQMDFRRFVEHTIRSEVPAHLLPKICWVNADDMARFEHAYRDWLGLHAGITRADRPARLQALIDALTGMKNQYPQRRLYDCLPEPDQAPPPPFILGRTALGSSPDHHDTQENDHG